MLRYRTKDITRINYRALSPAGAPHARMDKIKGRSDDMLKITRRQRVSRPRSRACLMGMEQIGPHYLLMVRREGYHDTLEVKVELTDGSVLEHYRELVSAPEKHPCQAEDGAGPGSQGNPRRAQDAGTRSRARPNGCRTCVKPIRFPGPGSGEEMSLDTRKLPRKG